MKKIARILFDVALMIVSAACFAAGIYDYFTEGSGFSLLRTQKFEFFCYGLSAFCYFGAFYLISRHFKRTWGKVVFAFLPATLFTAQVIIYNSFLQFLDFNDWWYYKYDEIIPYENFLSWDLRYDIGWGKYRYPFCFIAMFTLCVLAIFMQSEGFQNFREKAKEKIKRFLTPLCSRDFYALDRLADHYRNGYIGEEVLLQYCASMEEDEEKKRQIIAFCLKLNPCQPLYDYFIYKFGAMLSDEEIVYYRKKVRMTEEEPEGTAESE